MRFPVRVFFRCLSFLLIFFLLLPTFVSVAHAQTPGSPDQIGIQSGQTPNNAAYQFISPNVESNVPQNQHTFVQSLFLETLLALQCQLTGIDMSNPTKSCMGINLKTGKLGYAPSDPSKQGNIQIGGLLGTVSQSISSMYTPTFGSRDYFNYLSDNFGLVKQTHAADSVYTGFQGLQPILGLWKTTRDISYYLLIIAFIFIGIGVMLRLKIDPRTVMTIQNQIPRVIICIILITFSYAFAGLLVDTMWAITYMGINKITESANPDLTGHGDKLNKVATRYILSSPFSFADHIFVEENSPHASGILSLGWGVGQAIGRTENDIIVSLFFGGDNVTQDCIGTSGGFLGILPDINIKGCTQLVFSWIFGLLWFFIVAVALLIALFRIWLELVKAYLMVILYVVLAPLWIVFGLLPKKPLGFEKWLRILFSNLAVFPAVVFILVGARVLHDIFGQNSHYVFIPPLVGNPGLGNFGSILEFGMVLMAPQLLTIIREKLGVTPGKFGAAAMQTFNAARGAVGAPVKQSLKHLNQRDSYGNAVGALASFKDRAANKATSVGSKLLPGPLGRSLSKSHARREYMKNNAGSVSGFTDKSYKEGEEKYMAERKALVKAKKEAPRGASRKEAKQALKNFNQQFPNAGAMMPTRYDPSPGMPKPHESEGEGQPAGTQASGGNANITITLRSGTNSQSHVIPMAGGVSTRQHAISFVAPDPGHQTAAGQALQSFEAQHPTLLDKPVSSLTPEEQGHYQGLMQGLADGGHLDAGHVAAPQTPTTPPTSPAPPRGTTGGPGTGRA